VSSVEVFAALKFPGTAAPEPVETTMEGYVGARRQWHEDLGVLDGSLDPWYVNVSAIHSAAAMDVLLDTSIEASSSGDEYRVVITDVEGLYDDAGFVVFVDGELVSRPSCCSSFGEALHDWHRVINENSASWSMVWIGHPWQMVRIVDGLVELSEPTEADSSSLVASFPLDSFALALSVAEQDLREFVLRFAQRLGQRGFPAGIEDASRILGVGADLFGSLSS
jgi:hypothetical protein